MTAPAKKAKKSWPPPREVFMPSAEEIAQRAAQCRAKHLAEMAQRQARRKRTCWKALPEPQRGA